MRKEIDYLFRGASILLFTATLARSNRVLKIEDTQNQTPTPETSPLPTSTEALEVFTPYPTATPSFTENPSMTPTLEMSYVRENIDFGSQGKLSLSIAKDPLKYYSFGDIVVYPDEFKDENDNVPDTSTTEGRKKLRELQEKWLNKNFHPGDGTIVSKMDNLGNVILFIHDGYTLKGSKPLEAEAIRAYIEGLSKKTINDPDHIKVTMQSLVGAEIEMTKGEDISKFTVQAIVQIPHDQVAYYDSAEAIFENVNVISQNAYKTDGASEIVAEYVKNGGGTAISICGWGIVGEGEREELMTTYTRYVIFLVPKQTSQK